MRRHRATQTCLVAMQLRTILAQPPAEGERDHEVRRLFYALNVTDAENAAFEERFGVTLINGYGLSEAMTLLTCAPVVGPRRWPSIGLPLPGRRSAGRRRRQRGRARRGRRDRRGRLPGRDIMLGYYNDPEATDGGARRWPAAHRRQRLRRRAGYLYFFDRKKDMIKRAGENVSALEVEAVVLDHPRSLERR